MGGVMWSVKCNSLPAVALTVVRLFLWWSSRSHVVDLLRDPTGSLDGPVSPGGAWRVLVKKSSLQKSNPGTPDTSWSLHTRRSDNRWITSVHMTHKDLKWAKDKRTSLTWVYHHLQCTCQQLLYQPPPTSRWQYQPTLHLLPIIPLPGRQPYLNQGEVKTTNWHLMFI